MSKNQTIDINCSICNKQKVLEHQLEEWKLLNDYINKMDLGYQQSFVLIVSIFAGIAAVLSSNIVPKEMLKGIFIIPLGLVSVFAYLSYQFRITAILRGHLAALEEKKNKEIDENVHMWNSALVETFMAHNNMINKMMMIPTVFFIVVLVIYCAYFTWEALVDIPYRVLVYIAYWLVIVFFAFIVLLPFLKNDLIRKVTYDEQKVLEMYKIYQSKWKDETEKFKEDEIKDKELQRAKTELCIKSIVAGILNILLGFGVMLFFWMFGDKTQEIKGLFSYYAATIGDAIFLTGLIVFGWYFINANKKDFSIRRERTIRKISKTMFGVGILVQLSWLFDKNIEPNWTIPYAHHFTVAGWYHAFYFSVMFGVVTYIAIKAIILNRGKVVKAKLAYVFMWISGVGYWYTHLIDDCINENNYLEWLLISAGIIIVLFFVFEFRSKGQVRLYMSSYICFFVGMFVLSILFYLLCDVSNLEWDVLELFRQLNTVLRGGV